ncbi:acyl-CoA dehydrogenase family protein [Ramlibacter sp. AW1]|uniref:Acyl-CoA dehydrogenase family protein n=1 Tax=Ramlibacter aurantiacus TaxID=2801330 RepID=A0A937D9G5_9BURK|nr:acyl-CoA dehydrogenase family protein [Ramlibacter aurantiacus]MBL0423156.1 acyl-CoA dehydrogenase family protein [Ramlibacter aurantiacus]
MNYVPPLADNRYILLDVLDAPAQLRPALGAEAADPELMDPVLEEAARFVGGVVAPLRAVGDQPGCRYEDGRVTTPPGFRQAYQAFREAGWPALACAPEDGGQGLPWVLEGVLFEWLNAANHGWTMAPALLHGAYECLRHHGSPELKAAYLPQLASGEWLATMALTEPHAGSDLGLARTRAVPQADGSFRVSGTKIFISGGEHDLTDNIVHLVLGRLPDAPSGPKGLSLFLVPKLLPDGRRNGAHCDRIEEKMGLHGSPTCVMRFDEALGWIVGGPGRGLAAMFVMMNSARLHVALQGVGLLDAALQLARGYAAERRQMRVPGPRDGSQPADFIEGHPAIRRILDTQQAWVDAGRVLAYQTGIELDLARSHPDAARREAAQHWCSLLTPVLKAAWTDQGFHGASDCLQVFGGHGYVREWGIEQIVRDSRIAMIYEGTNEIQAIDLLLRKVLPDGGAALGAVLLRLARDLEGDSHAPLLTAIDRLQAATGRLAQAAAAAPQVPYWIAGDYLRATALVLMGWAWSRLASQPAAGDERWRRPAEAFRRWIRPELDMRLGMLETAS